MSTNSFLFRQQPSNLARFGVWMGYFFTINAVIGAGFLALPYSFSQSGWLLSLILMTIIGAQIYYIGLELLEITSRAECIKQLEEVGIEVHRPSLARILKGNIKSVEIPSEIRPEIVDRRFDVSALVEIIYGRNSGILYLVGLYLFLGGVLVGYVSIFASSFASIVPLGFVPTCNIYEDKEFFGPCRLNYWIFLLIYAVIMMYLTIKGLREQRWMQAALTLMRFVILFLIMITSIHLISSESNVKNSDHVPFKMPPAINISHILSSIPTITFSFISQLQFASIMEFVKDKEVNLKRILQMVSLTTYIVYAIISILVPIAIHDVKPQCSIDYSEYSAGYSQKDRPGWTYLIAHIIVLFPAFDVFSSFPVVAVTVADNLQSIREGVSNEDFMNLKNQKYYRAFTVTLPVLISFLMFNLSDIIDWVGMIGYLLVLVVFPLMHLSYRETINVKSHYDTMIYNKWFCLIHSIVNGLILIAVIANKIVLVFT